MMTFVKYTIVLLLLSISQKDLFAQINASRLSQRIIAQVEPGEGIGTFLRRFKITDPCDEIDFLITNNLVIGNTLYIGKDYFLPIILLDTLSRDSLQYHLLSDLAKTKAFKYNKNMIKIGYKRAEDDKLWIPTHFMACDNYEEDPNELPQSTTQKSNAEIGETPPATLDEDEDPNPTVMGPHPIFGLNYSDPQIKSQKLKNKVFYIVGGHGGPDPGAMAKVNGRYITEDEYAYDVALRLAHKLFKQGATVFLIVQDKKDGIRDKKYLKIDHTEVHYPNKKIPLNQVQRLRDRAKTINQLYTKYQKKGYKEQYMIAIHIDGRPKNQRIDLFFYHDPISKKGKHLAKHMKSFMSKKYNKFQKGRGYYGTASPRNLYVLKHTKPLGLFIEIGNLHNEHDRKRILQPRNRNAIAKWICDGILAYKY